MRQLLTIFLLVVFSAQVFQPAVIVFDYYSNTSAYAKNCVNRLRPALHCNGKCELMKKLQEEQGKEQQKTERKGEKVDFVSRTKGYDLVTVPHCNFSALTVTRYIDVTTCGHPQPIFHPPSSC